MTNPHFIETGADDTPRMGAEFERLLRLRRQGEINDDDMVVGLIEYGKTLERELTVQKVSLSDGMRKWIPVSERLPEDQTYCLTVERQHFHPFVPTVAYHSTKAGRHMLATAWIDSTGDYIDVTHWMPLPEAPK